MSLLQPQLISKSVRTLVKNRPVNNKGSKTLLVLSQVYMPDPTSVGQHIADAAVEMAKRGWRVVVFTADRGYENPSDKYKRYQIIDGVEVRRLPLTSFGKHSMALR